MSEEKKLTLRFDPNTIEHLGISLYSQLPSVLSELISNAWDADANNISIKFTDKDNLKSIQIIDDGHGMTFDELNNEFLLIGRNRRSTKTARITPNGRNVIGKKGLGKLSVFGICNIIEISSIKNGLKNSFEMNLDDIKKSEGEYNPSIIHQDVPTEASNGTTMHLKGIRRKSPFNLNNISLSLSKHFLIFDELKTTLTLNDEDPITITNEQKFESLNKQFEWKFPADGDSLIKESYFSDKNITGEILTAETPIKDTDMAGIYLVSRGKIVNLASFYGLRDNDQFHSYVTGYLNVDFIDDIEPDVISTNRTSLNWEDDETKKLQDYLQKVIRAIGNQWKRKRADLKKEEVKKNNPGIDIDKWQEKMPTFEKELSNKIIDPILSNAQLDTEQASSLVQNVMDKFNNETYKKYAEKFSELSSAEQFPDFLNLMNDWKMIESKQMNDLAQSRIEVIKQFEHYLETDTKEVPTLHNFLKKFSWLLDPRILEFRDEVTYSKLLKETYPDEALDIKDRRIDFLCSNTLGEILYVVEIKRSLYQIDSKSIEQAYEYGAFLTNKYASESGFSKVVCFVVGGSKSNNHLFKSKEETYRKSGEVFVKTYRELLEQSKEYHKEFLDLHNHHNNTSIV